MKTAHLRSSSLPADRDGAVAVLFAFSIIPIMMLVGLAFDLGWVTQARSQLDLAADSAAIATARTAADAYSRNRSDYISLATGAGTQWFAAQSGSVLNAQNISPAISVALTGRKFTATVVYNADVSEVLPNLFGWSRPQGAHIANTAVATITVNQFATIDFLLDNTSSMMIAATPADATRMVNAAASWVAASPANYNAVPDGLASTPCTFACHWTAAPSLAFANAGFSNDYYGLSRALGITLRYDVVQSATKTAINDMVSLEAVPGQLGVGVFSFGDPAAPFRTIFPEASIDGGGAVAALAAVQTVVTPVTPDVPNTKFLAAFTSLANTVSDSGTGNTALDPKKAVIFVSDGIEDDTNPQSIPTTEGPINPAVCTLMKNKGYTVYVLYTTYSSDPINLPFSNIYLVPYITGSAANDLVPALTSCASAPEDFVQASSPAGIQAAMTQLLNQAVGATTRLTN